MKLSDYHGIIDYMHSVGSKPGCIREISKVFRSYSMKTLGSIYSQDCQRKTKKTHHKHYIPDRMEEYYKRYLCEIQQGKKDVLLKISEDIDLASSLLARIIIERHLAYAGELDGETPPKHIVSQYLKDPSLIQDPVLAEEVTLCILTDQVYGPVVDVIKHSIGQEYECLLKHCLEKRELAFLGEDDLRVRGYDKTPDVKLEIPIAVDGHVVNWIESKASFGDEESHRGYLKEQFWSYWNRFGPGLVIYWFGFIDELDIHQEKGILLMDHFPENIVRMNPLTLLPQGLMQYSASVVQHSASIVQHSANMLRHGSQVMKHSDNVVKHSGNVVKHSGNVVKHSGNVVKHSCNVVNHSGNVVKHSGNVVDISGNMAQNSGNVAQLGSQISQVGANTKVS